MNMHRFAALLAGLLAALAVLPALAQQPFTVTALAPSTAEPRSSAAIAIRIEGQIAALPSFTYDIEGGTLLGVLAPTPIAAGIAEGTAFVTRDTPGTATLTVSFAGSVLARASVQFGSASGTLRVEALLDAGPDAAARTWRYEIVNPAGAVVAELQVGTSGDAPLGSTSVALPAGTYAVRQVLGSDTALACRDGIFYAVSQPAGAVATVTLAGGADATARFTITPCPDLPQGLEVLVPVDTISPGAGGIVGEPIAAPAEPPMSDVAGVRQPGPGVLPPAAGNSAAAGAVAPLPVLFASGFLLVLSGAGLLLARHRSHLPV